MKSQTPEPGLGVPTAEETTELEAHVQCRLGGRIRDFRLVVMKEGVILHGQAHTYYAKQLAQHAVLNLSPLHIVANEIEVS